MAYDPYTRKPVIGYVYYEEKEGNLTSDGTFKPFDTDKVPSYGGLTKNTALRATRTAQIRKPGKGESDYVMSVKAGQCFNVLYELKAFVAVTEASSGGWVHFEAVTCPPQPGPQKRQNNDISVEQIVEKFAPNAHDVYKKAFANGEDLVVSKGINTPRRLAHLKAD